MFRLDEKKGYFNKVGVDVMAFDDIYPVGHQSGVGIIMHGNRVATNGDLRFEQTPGQWQPVPKQYDRKLNTEDNSITTWLRYPDEEQHLKGFNPIIYPDIQLTYQVKVIGTETGVRVVLDLDKEIPECLLGKACFNLELFPGALFGKPWIMDDKQGIFPRQANGPTMTQKSNISCVGHFDGVEEKAVVEELTAEDFSYSPMIADDIIAEPYAVGNVFTVRPDDPYNRFTIESHTAQLKLYDGRMNHNNGWFVVSSEIPAGATKHAIEWDITLSVVEDWLHTPVVQVSQVGYHPNQPKQAVIELDNRDANRCSVVLKRFTAKEIEVVREYTPIQVEEWGHFLRYHYLRVDFSDIKEEGLYQFSYGEQKSAIFRIAKDIYDRGVWQPVLEYFLPVQMCHMRVSEKYKVWHGHCHADDATMAPLNRNHVDGYIQGPQTMTKYHPGDVVPGLDKGGWHDAGDHDLRVESQAGESYILTLAYEEFGVDYDATTIDQNEHIVEIHQPDGKNDILQQIEHGMLTVVGSYNVLGRLYRGIIANSVRRYVILGDMAQMTKGIKGDGDDRWVFTEDNPIRELQTAGRMAASARALRGFNNTLSDMAIQAAKELFDRTNVEKDIQEEKALYEATDAQNAAVGAKIFAATELFLTTKEEKYRQYILGKVEVICKYFEQIGWNIARVDALLEDEGFSARIREILPTMKAKLEEMSAQTPYQIPYKPYIWGAGWQIQSLAFQYYFLHKAYPDVFGPELIYHALDFVLGCHPGSNTASFASGVGAKSATVAYGMNRADWSYIPGGVVSGTALIRPDLPELLEFPYLWQQMEYVLGGGSSNYMFMVLAAQKLLQ